MNAPFFRNTDTLNPVLFYFSSVDDLKQYSLFFKDEAPISTQHGTVTAHRVIGRRIGTDALEVIAEFPNQLYAQIFRDMAERAAR
ncbi:MULTISPECIES: hypothetical protein [Burkholderia]|uniref:hypothetical protein n=1 Tax=Burkholderia TaxID=32008 RepID=UPI0007537E36|nr:MULTISPECIES: hypothetical protein [Burkholderia]KVE37244.1 hypothetical protein WS68_03250 [Burkholderia sp. TSV86]MDN7664082.1 hypothetical protein [Burkholderia cenocepacia]